MGQGGLLGLRGVGRWMDSFFFALPCLALFLLLFPFLTPRAITCANEGGAAKQQKPGKELDYDRLGFA